MDAVCNFQSMKSPVELNSLSSKFFCYITWLDATLDDLQTRPLRQILLFFRNNSLAVKKKQRKLHDKTVLPWGGKFIQPAATRDEISSRADGLKMLKCNCKR